MRQLLTILLVAAGCDDAGRPSPPVDAPSRVFVFDGVQIEQRRAGRVLWSGTAERADGDLHEADVENLVITYLTVGPASKRYELHSPRAHLALDDGRATFENVRIIDEAGGRLEAAAARYDETEASILAEGPILFAAQGLEARATSGLISLEDGTIDIKGPVTGTWRGTRRP